MIGKDEKLVLYSTGTVQEVLNIVFNSIRGDCWFDQGQSRVTVDTTPIGKLKGQCLLEPSE